MMSAKSVCYSQIHPLRGVSDLVNIRFIMSNFGQIADNESFSSVVPIESLYPDLAQNFVSNATTDALNPEPSVSTRIIYWYHPDYVGNVDLVTDLNQEAYEFYLYNPWGESLYHWESGSSSWNSPFRFNSKEFDAETDMHYYGARYHHPKLSVWMSVDPLTAATQESYQFTANNPIDLIDPDGGSPISIFAKKVAKTGLKRVAKEAVEATVKNRLKNYMSKGWAKQLAGDALDAIDLATSQSWWEYAIEFIPIAGDAYGVAKLGEQGYAVYKITQRFEALAGSAAKAATRGWKKLSVNSSLSGKGGDLVQQYTKKFNNQGTALDEEHLVAATRDIFGQPILKADGTAWDHLSEVENSIRGMGNQLARLRKQIDSGYFEGDALIAAEKLYEQVQKRKDAIQQALNQARKAFKELE
jgi:RHS repeat-associated protein